MADVVGQVPGQLPTFTSGHNPQAGVPGGGTVTSISGVSPIATVPSPIVGAGTVQFPSWPADAPGELTNDGAGVLSWETDVGNFVRLLADPTIDQDVGGFHVTLSGLSDTAFLVNTLTNPGDAKFRALGTTDDFIELEYTTAAANSYSGLRLQGPAARTLEINLFGSGTSGVAHGWDGTVYDLPAGSALYGAGVDAHWFKLSGSTDYTGSFQLYDNGANFFPALSLVSIDGGAAVGAVTVGANPRINAIPPDFSVFHGATTATGLGAERLRITHEFENGQMFFGNVAGAGAAIQATSDLFQFVGDGDSATFAIGVQPSDTGQVQIALHALDAGNSGDGVHFSAYAVPSETEDLGIRTGGFDRIQVPGLNLGSSTQVIFRGNDSDPSDTQKSTLLWRATDTGTNTSEVSVGIELPNSVGVDGDLVIFTGGVEALRISGVDQKVTMPGVLDPPEIQVINKTPSDTATSTLFWSATDSGANTFNVSAGIELPNSVGVAGDLVVRTGGSGASGSGTERIKIPGSPFFPTILSRDTSDGNSALNLASTAAASGPIYIEMNAVGGTGSSAAGYVGAADFVGNGNGVASFLGAFAGAAALTPNGLGSFFVGGTNTGGSGGRVSINANNDGYFLPLAGLHVIAGTVISGETALLSSSLSGISALFQTSATDGSNANPTLVARANTGQTSPVFAAQDETPTTLLELAYVPVADFSASFFSWGSRTGISGLFQTPVTDGSNGLPTMVVLSNTDQTSDLLEVRALGVSIPLFSVASPGLGNNVFVSTLANDIGFESRSVDGTAVVGTGSGLGSGGEFQGFTGVVGRGTQDASGYFRTTVTDGSNPNETLEVVGNTAQTAPLQTWRGPAGAIVGSMSIAGLLDAAAFSAGGTPGITGTVTTASLIGKTLTFTNGLITGFA